MLALTKTPGQADSLAGGSQPQAAIGARLLNGALWSIVGAALARGLNLGAAVIAARLLGITTFGELGMIQSTQGLFGVFAGAGLGLAATKHVAEFHAQDPRRSGRCITLSVRFALLTGLVATLGLALLSPWIAATVLSRPELGTALRLASLLVLLGAVSGVQTGCLAGLEQFRLIAVVGVLRGVFLIGATIMGIAWAGLTGAIVALAGAETVAVVTQAFCLRPHSAPLRGSDGWREFRHVWRFSLFALLGNLATMPAMWLGNVVLVRQPQGYAALGIFNAADRWRQVLQFLPASLASPILALLSSLHGARDAQGYRRVFRANLVLTMIIVALPSAVLIVFSNLAMELFGREYGVGSITLTILALSAVAYVLNGLLGQVLVSQGAIGLRFLVDIMLAALLAAVAWWLVPAQGANGLALGYLVAYGAAAVSLVIPVHYYLRRRQNEDVPGPPVFDEGGVP